MLWELIEIVIVMGLGLALIGGLPIAAAEIIRRRSLRRLKTGSRIRWHRRS